MEVEAVRSLVTMVAIITGATGLLALTLGWRALLALPIFGLAFALPSGIVTVLTKLFIGATGAWILYALLAAHLRFRYTVPEFGRPSRRSRSISVVMLALGAGMAVGCTSLIWLIWLL